MVNKEVPFKALKRTESKIPALLEKHKNKELINWVDGDIRDFLSLSAALENVDQIIHCAALISLHKEDYSLMWDTNVTGTINILNLALDKQIKRFMHISSVAALGRGEKSSVDESAQWYKSPNNSYYAETKYAAEVEVWRAYEEGLPAVILNPSTVFGPSDWETGSTQIFKYIWKGASFYPKGYLNYVDVRDVSFIAVKLMEMDTVGERFILNAGRIDYKSLFEKIAINFDRKPPSKQLKNWMLKAAPKVEKIRSFFIGERPIITRESAQLSDMSYDFRNDKIKSFLNFEFKPLEDTIVWTCKELKNLNS